MGRPNDVLATPPPPAPTRADSEQIVEAIVAATLASGDPELSINAIADRAGVGIASVYRYFPNKAAIYAEISRRLQRDFLVQLRALLARPGLTFDEALEGVARLAVVVPIASPALRRMLNLSLPLAWSEDSAREIFSAAIDDIVAWLDVAMPAPPADLPMRVFAAFAAARGLVAMSRLIPERAPDDDVLIRHIVIASRAHLAAS